MPNSRLGPNKIKFIIIIYEDEDHRIWTYFAVFLDSTVG